MKNEKNNDKLKSIYPQGELVCPICGKEFQADDDTRYIIGGGFTCSWKCFLTESKRQRDEKLLKKKISIKIIRLKNKYIRKEDKMKILKNNYDKSFGDCIEQLQKATIKPYPRKLICEQCQSELEYEESDLRMGAYGCMWVDCPCCNHDNMLEDNENNITLTKDNIEFPIHFHHISKEEGAVDCCNNERIKEYIRKAIDYFRKNKSEQDWGGYITGNLYIQVHRWSGDEEYEVTICNDFYSMQIPFEPQDYETI